MPKHSEPYRLPDSELAPDPFTVEWSYRCSECGHGAHLEAHTLAVAKGPLHPDGLLAWHDDVDDAELFEDSIQCVQHPDALIEHRVNGAWWRWYSCDRCMGAGRLRGDYFDTYRPCPAEGYDGAAPDLYGRRPHSGWLIPVDDKAPVA